MTGEVGYVDASLGEDGKVVVSEMERNGYTYIRVEWIDVDVVVRIARANGVKWAVRRAARHTYGRSESVARGWKRVSEASGHSLV